MKNLILLASLLLATSLCAQKLRLDSLVHHNFQNDFDNYVKSFSYYTDRDFTEYLKKIKNGQPEELWTTVYRDSLKVESTCELSNGGRIIKEFKYDSLRRFSSVVVSGPGPYSLKVTKTYWRDSKLTSMEERVSFNKRDTTTYRITIYTYDDQLREQSKYYYNKDESGKITKDSSFTTYYGDSLVVANYSWLYKDDDWNRYTFRTRSYPEEHFGDTVFASYILYIKNEEENIQDTQIIKKITWGTDAINDAGYIKYENDIINGSFIKYYPTDHGYILEQYGCHSGKGFEWWRDDIKNEFHLTSTHYVSLNQSGQPVSNEEIDAYTGTLKSRIDYYYQEGGVEFKNYSTLFPTASCKIIKEFNPNFLYYDVSGKLVSSVTGSAYLIEKTQDGTNRVLFIEE